MAFIRDEDLSPIYRKLYQRVAQLPAIQNIQERMMKDLREARVQRVKYSKSQYREKVEVTATVFLGSQSQDITFTASGDDPNVRLEVAHLVDDNELLEIYFDKVGRTGKPIKPHGLVQENTVKYGAEPRRRNAFAPWMNYNLFASDQFKSAKRRAQHRIATEILTRLAQDPAFVDFSEEVSMQSIVNALKQYSHLPPDSLHRAIDLMYVETTMEK